MKLSMGLRIRWEVSALLIVACVMSGCSSEVKDDRPFLTRRAEFKTKLTSPGPSPQDWRFEIPRSGIEQVTYPSGKLELQAWLHVPEADGSEKHPALVFFHGGFAFGASDMAECQPFIDAGYVVMTPWLRGENGLRGNFEMFYGELDDAAASVRWLSQQPYVDADRIYAFGHSSGGVLSALLSLVEDVPIRHSGSSGGLYGTDLFDLVDDTLVPFDKSDPVERQLRVLPGNIRWMQRAHYAYIGNQDTGVANGVREANREIANKDSQLRIIMLQGDHFSSYPVAMRKYLELIAKKP